MAIEAYTAPGDRVALLSPVYGPFFSTVRLHGREVADCPLRLASGRYEMDWQAIEKTLSDERTKLFLLCNPQNPSGRVWEADELLELGRLCKREGVCFSAMRFIVTSLCACTTHFSFIAKRAT